MTLRPLSPQQAESTRDRAEEVLSQASYKAMRGYLRDVNGTTQRALRAVSLQVALLAAGDDELPTLGYMAERWTEYVDQDIMRAVELSFKQAYRKWTGEYADMDSPEMSGARAYLANVRNRLVTGTYFGVTVYDDSFNRIRSSIATGYAEGWSRSQLAQRIATELSWETDGAYWRSELHRIDNQIDDILDAIGQPGNPARETARLNDPAVQRLRDDRNNAIKHLDDEHSSWKNRANLIARTESTGVSGYGAKQAFVAEGVLEKAWVSTGDGRTRHTHRDASGQAVSVDTPFLVGQALLDFPGDPQGPVQEIANCRCTMVANDYLSVEDKNALRHISEGGNF